MTAFPRLRIPLHGHYNAPKRPPGKGMSIVYAAPSNLDGSTTWQENGQRQGERGRLVIVEAAAEVTGRVGGVVEKPEKVRTRRCVVGSLSRPARNQLRRTRCRRRWIQRRLRRRRRHGGTMHRCLSTVAHSPPWSLQRSEEISGKRQVYAAPSDINGGRTRQEN